jgi:hypothetical protein
MNRAVAGLRGGGGGSGADAPSSRVQGTANWIFYIQKLNFFAQRILNYWPEYKGITGATVIFLKFIITVRGGHRDYSPPSSKKPRYVNNYDMQGENLVLQYTPRSCMFNTNYFVVTERKLHDENGSQLQKCTSPAAVKYVITRSYPKLADKRTRIWGPTVLRTTNRKNTNLQILSTVRSKWILFHDLRTRAVGTSAGTQ